MQISRRKFVDMLLHGCALGAALPLITSPVGFTLVDDEPAVLPKPEENTSRGQFKHIVMIDEYAFFDASLVSAPIAHGTLLS